MTDVLAELEKVDKLRQVDIDWFTARGVPPLALARSWAGDYGFLAKDRVAFDGARFEFRRYLRDVDGTAEAYVVPALDEMGDVLDIIAFRPGRAGSWLGRAPVLGMEQVFNPRVGDDALDVHENVVGWLRADRRGVVILDARNAAWLLALVGPLRARCVEHGRKVRAALTIQAPRIVVSDPVREKAA